MSPSTRWLNDSTKGFSNGEPGSYGRWPSELPSRVNVRMVIRPSRDHLRSTFVAGYRFVGKVHGFFFTGPRVDSRWTPVPHSATSSFHQGLVVA